MHVDGNFPAPMQVLAFLGSATLTGVLVLVSLYGFARKKTWAKKTVAALLGSGGLYFFLLAGFSVFSHEQILPRGQEKYFCEIDCHLAYSIAHVNWLGEGAAQKLAVTIRTRFDENTVSAHRPTEAPLLPNPRNVVLVDSAGHTYVQSGLEGRPLTTELIPGESYTTTLTFIVTRTDSSLRLLITSTDRPMKLLIGNEMSWGHKKTFLGV